MQRFRAQPPILVALLVLAVLSTAAGKAGAQTPFVAGTGITGSWYNPDRDGEGFLVEILSGDQALVTWFTYDTNGEQMWLLGSGRVTGNRVLIDQVIRTSGATFGPTFNPDAVVRSDWGSIALTFTDCDTGFADYSGPPGFGEGTIALVRLTELRHAPCDPHRPFRLGFTAFPHEASQAGVDEAFRLLREDADLVSLHHDDGLPWPEALASEGAGIDNYPEAWRADWEGKKERLPPTHDLLISITPIAFSRDQLAPYNDGTGGQPLSSIGAPWDVTDFSHPDVVNAYINHAMNTVAFFRPDYLLVGIEVNLLHKEAPHLWPSYVTLQQQVYTALKARWPSLTVLLSFTALDMLDGLTDANSAQQRLGLRQVEAYTDYFGMSLYPYLTALLTDPIPEDLFTRLSRLSRLPYAVTETGYYSEFREFEFDEGPPLTLAGTRAKQSAWIETLLGEAERRDYRFIVNFVGRDYDALCDQIECSEVDRIWEATGLVDEDGADKPAMSVWRSYLERPVRR